MPEQNEKRNAVTVRVPISKQEWLIILGTLKIHGKDAGATTLECLKAVCADLNAHLANQADHKSITAERS